MATFLITLKSILFIILYFCTRETRGGRGRQIDLLYLYPYGSDNDVSSLGCKKVHKDAISIKDHPMMTSLWCTQQCWRLKTKVALMKGAKCLCYEKAYPRDLKVPDSQCSTPCPGNKVEQCGGNNVASALYTGHVQMKKFQLDKLYRLAVQYGEEDKRLKTAVMAKNDKGKCVKWKPRPAVYFTSWRMTVKICVVICHYNKFVFALLSVGMACTCTSVQPTQKASEADTLRETEGVKCDKKCKGNSTEICGGEFLTHSAYLTGHYNTKDAILGLKANRVHKALEQNWLPFLVKNNAILMSMKDGKAFVLRTPPPVPGKNVTITDDKNPETTTNVTTAVSVSVVVSVLVSLGVCIFLKCRPRKKEPDYAALAEEEKMKKKKKKKSRKSGRKPNGGDRSGSRGRQHSPRKIEKRT